MVLPDAAGAADDEADALDDGIFVAVGAATAAELDDWTVGAMVAGLAAPADEQPVIKPTTTRAKNIFVFTNDLNIDPPMQPSIQTRQC